MKKSTAIILIICSVVTAVVLTAGLTLTWATNYIQKNQVVVNDSDYEILDMIKGMFQSYGLEPPSDEDMLMAAAHAMASQSGDIYAEYFTADEYAEFVQDQLGNYSGIGVTVQMDLDRNVIVIIHVIKNSPADEAGLVAGDVFISVDGKSTAGMSTEDLADLVRGEEGTEVKVGIQHVDGSAQEYAIDRRQVSEDFVNGKMLTDDIMYVQITQFQGDADYEFANITKKLIKQGAKAMVLDLRNNPGGDKQVVCNIADMLLPKGPIIICENRNGDRKTDYSDETCLGIPIVVLANEYSASASELLIGALQDYEAATFVGTQTFGKGIVQTFMYMPDGKSIMKLTTDRYLTPKERSIHGIGCTPDEVLEPSEALDSNPILLGTEQDNQLARALEILREKLK